jgi:hypothetical protein
MAADPLQTLVWYCYRNEIFALSYLDQHWHLDQQKYLDLHGDGVF